MDHSRVLSSKFGGIVSIDRETSFEINFDLLAANSQSSPGFRSARIFLLFTSSQGQSVEPMTSPPKDFHSFYFGRCESKWIPEVDVDARQESPKKPFTTL